MLQEYELNLKESLIKCNNISMDITLLHNMEVVLVN